MIALQVIVHHDFFCNNFISLTSTKVVQTPINHNASE